MTEISLTTSAALTEMLAVALQRHGLAVSPETEGYVEGLLRHYFSAEQFHALQKGTSSLEESIISKLCVPHGTSEGEKIRIFKEVADACLFTTGFFYDAAKERGSTQFYCEIGSGAYRRVGEVQGPLFLELAEHFKGLVLVIGDLWLPAMNEKKMVELYEKWEKTRSPYYFSLLSSLGLIPVRDDSQPS